MKIEKWNLFYKTQILEKLLTDLLAPLSKNSSPTTRENLQDCDPTKNIIFLDVL